MFCKKINRCDRIEALFKNDYFCIISVKLINYQFDKIIIASLVFQSLDNIHSLLYDLAHSYTLLCQKFVLYSCEYYAIMRRFNFSFSQAQINFDYIDYFYSIAELPSPSESGGEMEGGNFPLVTHPGSELMEDEGDQGSLTSPNLGKY